MLPQSLQQPIESQARDIFFAHYVSEGSRGWDFLIFFRNSQVDFLHRSIDAASLAFVARQQTSASIMNSAQASFGAALRLLGRAIPYVDPASGKELLASTLLLDLFTKIAYPGPGNLAFWRNHLNGALALIDALGLDNLQDQVSLRILSRFFINSIVSCVASATSVPARLNLVWAHVTRLTARGEDPKWKLTQAMMDCAALREYICQDFGSPEDRVRAAQLLDQRLLQISKQMPHHWHPKIIYADDPHSKVPVQYDSYKDRNVTQGSNVLRLVRIMLNEFLQENLNICMEVDGSKDPTLEMSPIQTISTLVTELSASVYQYAGGCCIHRKSGSGKPTHSPKQILDCYTLLYPLYVAGRSIFISNTQRSSIIRDLRFIHSHLGIENACLVADTIENDPGKDPWQVFASIGSYGFAA